MIESPVGNLATFDALFQLSSLNAYRDRGMNSRDRAHTGSGEKMSALVSGSIADDPDLEHIRYDILPHSILKPATTTKSC